MQHLIWSGLIDVTKLTNGKFPNVYHFDSKAHIESYIRSIGVPSSTFMAGFYMSNLETMLNPSSQAPHAYAFAMPMPPTTPIPCFDAAGDTGKFVKAMLMKRDKVLGKNVLAATDYYAAADVPKIFEQVKKEAGKGAQFVTIDKDTYKGFLTGAGMPDFAAQELYENMAFMDEFGYFGKESLDWSLSVRTVDGSKRVFCMPFTDRSPFAAPGRGTDHPRGIHCQNAQVERSEVKSARKHHLNAGMRCCTAIAIVSCVSPTHSLSALFNDSATGTLPNWEFYSTETVTLFCHYSWYILPFRFRFFDVKDGSGLLKTCFPIMM